MRMRSGYPKLKDEDKDKDDGKDGRGCPKLDHKAMIRNRSWARTRMKIRKLTKQSWTRSVTEFSRWKENGFSGDVRG